jgi:hypothetical protein
LENSVGGNGYQTKLGFAPYILALEKNKRKYYLSDVYRPAPEERRFKIQVIPKWYF